MRVEIFDDQGKPVAVGKKESSCARRHFPRCLSGSGTIPTAKSIERRTSTGILEYGVTATMSQHTEHDGMIIYGRSDAVLNPGGVRIGTAEIYRQVEQIAGGDRKPGDRPAVGTRRAYRPVRSPQAQVCRSQQNSKIASGGGSGRTRRHGMCRRESCKSSEIPRTKSGKIVELAVRDIVHGRQIKNADALANPEALEEYRNRAELRE